ncbi:MAG TPA: GNAT family N-acetyltransferase [Chitinophagaceae bacterium]|jgi:ribosomal protein S18 acetylase RimI-like enzyme|nr:GNAT family N-acetyltransferase [Chitinophagaceae bacterium]
MNIKIIKADPSHVFAISSIGKQSFRDAFGYLFLDKATLQEYLEYTYQPDKIEKSIQKQNNVFFLAFMENVPVGFAKVKKHSLNEQIESIAQMELQKIYVLSYYHGSGAGKALMKAVLELAQKIQPDFLWLDTHISNEKAIRFYEKRGFKKTGKRYFTIGTQTFEYHLMSLPIAVMQHC